MNQRGNRKRRGVDVGSSGLTVGHLRPRNKKTAPNQSAPQTITDKLISKPGKWLLAICATVVATSLTEVLTGIPGQIFDSAALKDHIRQGPDIRINASIVQMPDQGLEYVVPGGLPSQQIQDTLAQPGGVTNPIVAKYLEDNGFSLHWLSIQLVLEGRRSEVIRITNINPRLIGNLTAPADGTFYNFPPQEGDASIQMTLNLDEPATGASEMKYDKEEHPIVGGPSYFSSKTISLKDGEQQGVSIRAIAEKASASFDLEIHYLIGGKELVSVVDNHGRPFRITGPRCSAQFNAGYKYMYDLEGDFSAKPAHVSDQCPNRRTASPG